MTAGSRTPDDVRLAFAAEYLRTGSPRQAAKSIGLAIRTGYDIADELDDDPKFAQRRARLHARALDRSESAVMLAIDVLSDRIENAVEILGGGKDKNGEERQVMVVDKSADYGRSIANLNDSLLKRRKLEDDVEARAKGNAVDATPVEVVIRVKQDDTAG
jgi:hypothetical protein